MRELLWRGIAKIVSQPRVADWLIRRAKQTPYRPIPEDGSYMERWWLFNAYEGENEVKVIKWLPSIRIHHIKRPDRDRHFHDHPWNARTIILKGFYHEQRLEYEYNGDWHPTTNDYDRKPGSTAKLNFGEYHRIASTAPEGVWTLFFTWKYEGVWGFLVDGVKVPWRTYLNDGGSQ